MTQKDYYKILGVDKNASTDDIKKAFRKLSVKYHPDKVQDESKKKEYTEKFQEINEAYSILSDKDKRAQYDNPMQGFGGMPFGDMADFMNAFGGNPFDAFGGFGFNRQQRRVNKGSSLRIVVDVTLEELFHGGTKKLQYNKKEKCESCNGSGKTAQSVEESCPYCGGTGTLFQRQGNFQQISTCPHCQGKGKTLKNPCPCCKGEGIADKQSEIEVIIPKGVMDNAQLELSGYGNAAPHGDGIYGDLYIVFRTKPHPTFKRGKEMQDPSDIYVDININIVDAILGCAVEVPTIDGKKILATIKPGITEGSQVRFKGRGLPKFQHDTIRGDMYGIVHVKMPQELDNDERALLEQLKTKKHFQ